MRIWLDDIREMPEGFDYWAKFFKVVMRNLLLKDNHK
jgi:hypothetical protein